MMITTCLILWIGSKSSVSGMEVDVALREFDGSRTRSRTRPRPNLWLIRNSEELLSVGLNIVRQPLARERRWI